MTHRRLRREAAFTALGLAGLLVVLGLVFGFCRPAPGPTPPRPHPTPVATDAPLPASPTPPAILRPPPSPTGGYGPGKG